MRHLSPRPRPESGPGWTARPFAPATVAAVLFGVAVVCGALILVPGVRESLSALLGASFRGDGAAFRDEISGYGVFGPLVSFGLALIHIVVPFPAEILALANGLAFGFWGGLAVTWGGFMVAALLTYGLGRALGRPVMVRFVPQRQRARLDSWLAQEGFFPLLVMRLIPLVPFNALCLACGVLRVKFWTYLWVTAVGILPVDIALSLIGSRLGETGEGASGAELGWGFWLITASLVAFVLAAWMISRRIKAREERKRL